MLCSHSFNELALRLCLPLGGAARLKTQTQTAGSARTLLSFLASSVFLRVLLSPCSVELVVGLMQSPEGRLPQLLPSTVGTFVGIVPADVGGGWKISRLMFEMFWVFLE